jgi:hypothetical protein
LLLVADGLLVLSHVRLLRGAATVLLGDPGLKLVIVRFFSASVI